MSCAVQYVKVRLFAGYTVLPWKYSTNPMLFFIREILVEESNVQRVDSPVTVSLCVVLRVCSSSQSYLYAYFKKNVVGQKSGI